MTPEEAVQTRLNGNISDFTEWVKQASKLELLEAIESFRPNYLEMINYMQSALEEANHDKNK